MKLSVAFILFELKKNAEAPRVILYNLSDGHTGLSGLRILGSGAFLNDVLYVAAADDVRLGMPLPPHLLIAGIPEFDLAGEFACVDLTLTELINRIELMFYTYNAIEEALNSAIARSEPLRTILSICARFFNNVITINDLRMRFVETSDNAVRDKMPEYFKVVLDTGYIDIRLMTAMKKRGYDKLINTSSDALFFDLEEIPVRYFSKNIYEGGQIAACLVIHEIFSPLDLAQTVLVDQVTQIVDNYAFKSPRGKQTSMTPLEQVVSELIAGGKYDDDIHALYLRQINWGVKDGYYLIKIQVGADNYKMSTAQYTFASAQSFFPASLLVENDDSATVIVCAAQIRYDFQSALSRLESYLADRGDKAAISRRFESFSNLYEHNTAVSMALKLGDAIDPDRHLYRFEAYALPVMLKMCSHQIDLRVFCLTEALTLRQNDKENGSELFKSLYVYLKHNRSLAQASEELKVHRNTLLYRLGRVTEITGIDPSDDAILFPMLLSYEILHYRLKLEDTPSK